MPYRRYGNPVCENCSSGYHNPSMIRAYIRVSSDKNTSDRRTWKPIGWFCEKCGKFMSEKEAQEKAHR